MLLGSVSILGVNGGMLRIRNTQVAENVLSSQAKPPHRRTNANVISLRLHRRLPLLSPLIIQTRHQRVDIVHLVTATIVAPVGRRRLKLDGRLLRQVQVMRLFLP